MDEQQWGPGCPRCGREMAAVALEGHPALRCRSCEGTLLPRRVLPAVLERIAPPVDPDQPMAVVPDPGGGLQCPGCRGEMEHHGYMEARYVRIDRCPRCDVVFTDAGELEAMAAQRARSQRRTDAAERERLQEQMRTWRLELLAPRRINRW